MPSTVKQVGNYEVVFGFNAFGTFVQVGSNNTKIAPNYLLAEWNEVNGFQYGINFNEHNLPHEVSNLLVEFKEKAENYK